MGLFLIALILAIGQPEIRIQALEHRIHDLVNSERRTNHLRPLTLDSRLSDIARAHSRDMAARGFFSHKNPDGKDPQERANAAGYSCHSLGENIFQNNLYSRVTTIGNRKSYDWNTPEKIATTSVNGWMSSSGHRHNILTRHYDRTGIGVAIAGDGKVYITQMFCGSV